LDLYYASGVASSVVFDDTRTPTAVVNLTLSSGPRCLPGITAGIALNVANLVSTAVT